MINKILNLLSVSHHESLEEIIFGFLKWLCIWTGYFLIVNTTVKPEKHWTLSNKHADDIRNRVVSITHGLFSFIVTTYHIIKHSPQYNEPITDFQHFLIIMSMAYFTYDLIACIYYHLTDSGLYIHHFLVIFGYLMDEVYGYGGTETLSNYYYIIYILSTFSLLVGLFFAEISNSPMHMRKILRSLKLRYTKSHEVLEMFYFGITFKTEKKIIIVFFF